MFLRNFFVYLCWYTVQQSQFFLKTFMDASRPESLGLTPHTQVVEKKIFAIENILRKARSRIPEGYDAVADELRDHTGAIEDIMFELGFELDFDEEFVWQPPDTAEPPAKLARSDNNNGGGLDDRMVDS